MLEMNNINIVRNLLDRGQQILAREPTPQMCREMVAEAKRRAKGTGLLDMATETVAMDLGSDLGADLARAFGLKVKGGRRVGKSVGSNLARNASVTRLHNAEVAARGEFQQRMKMWVVEA